MEKANSRKLSLLAVACSVSTFQPHFRDPFLRPVRAATFGSLAVVTMVPVVHGATVYGWQVQNQRMGITWVLITLMLNVLGATAYAIKVRKGIKFFEEITVPCKISPDRNSFPNVGSVKRLIFLELLINSST